MNVNMYVHVHACLFIVHTAHVVLCDMFILYTDIVLGVYGQCKYVYYGKHSEGNRFIRNQHL